MVPMTVSRAICTVCTKNANGLYKRIYQERFCACIRVNGWRVVRCSSSCFDFLPHNFNSKSFDLRAMGNRLQLRMYMNDFKMKLAIKQEKAIPVFVK